MSMTQQAAELIDQLNAIGFQLWCEGEQLHYRAPRGVATPEVLSKVKQHKAELIQLLSNDSGMLEIIADPAGRGESFPLTDVQAAYLVGRNDAFGYGGVACHLYLTVDYSALDVPRVAAAWNALVQRHDMLRMTIDDQGAQRVLPTVPLMTVAEYDAHVDVEALLGHKVYQASQWPLFEVAVSHLDGVDKLHLSLDFLMADWASVRLLLGEFEQQYFHPEQPLPTLGVSFRDYVLAQCRQREQMAWQRDRAYWQKRLADIPPAPILPLKADRNLDQPARFRRLMVQLNARQWQALKLQAALHHLTPTAVVMTAYAAVLERWSQQSDFTLNLTVLNRQPLHPDINRIVGDFTSVSLLAVQLRPDTGFAEQAAALSDTLFTDLDHRLYSGVEVMRDIVRERGRDAALMPIVFTSAIGVESSLNSAPLIGDIDRQGITQTPQVFIDCQAMDDADGLRVNWDIRESVFPIGLVEAMSETFGELLVQLANEPDGWQRPLDLPLPAAQQALLAEVNDTVGRVPDTLLWQPIAAQARTAPDAVAVIDAHGSVTYAELLQQAKTIANALRLAGCRAGSPVAISAQKGRHLAAATLGALLCGAVFLPLDSTQPYERRNDIIERAEARWLLHDGSLSDGLGTLPEGVTALDVTCLSPLETAFAPSLVSPDDAAYIIFTSGSTGLPKGVVISHRAAANTIVDINQRYGIGPQDRALALAQPSFDLSVYDLFGLLSAGGTLVYPEPARQTDPSHWAQCMTAHRVTIWNSAPALMQMLVTYLETEPQQAPHSLRLVMLSGDWIPLTLPDALLAHLPEVAIVALGGATEASIWSNYHDYHGVADDWRSIPYGRPLRNQRFAILDHYLRPCPIHVPGELFIGGAGLAQGYLNDADTTAQRFITLPHTGERLYRTGDSGRWMASGEMEFLGRLDNQLKLHGHRIEPGEIEHALLQHPAVRSAAVTTIERNGHRQLLAVVVLSEPCSGPELKAFVSQRVPAYMVPTTVQVVDHLPVTSNGKLDRRALEALPETAISAPSVSASPLMQQLHDLWAKALGVATIAPDQNFYALGADSLIMASVTGQLRETLSEARAIPFDQLLRQLLNQPTLEALEYALLSAAAAPTGAGSTASQPSKEVAASTSVARDGVGRLRLVLTADPVDALIDALNAQQAGTVVTLALTPDVLQQAQDYVQSALARGYQALQLVGCGKEACRTAFLLAQQLEEQGIDPEEVALIALPDDAVEQTALPAYMGNVRLIAATGVAATAHDAYWQPLCLGEFSVAEVDGDGSDRYLSAAASLLYLEEE